MRPTYLLSLLLPLSAAHTSAAFNDTADWYKCSHRTDGDWSTYGRVKYACDASDFGDDGMVRSTYPGQIFLDAAERAPERNRYAQELHAVLRDAALYYLKKHKPQASAEERDAWVLAIILTAAHETRMSHYRVPADQRMKMMRGDNGHGHGIMQVDDRWHFNVVNSGVAWNLVSNIFYGMDVYFEQWERAPSMACASALPDRWEARIRSAWAAFNGGGGSICRWNRPDSQLTTNDKNFLAMYRSQEWKPYVADLKKAASIDVPCLAEKKTGCPLPGQPGGARPKEGALYKDADGKYCRYAGGAFRCVAEARDAICLGGSGTASPFQPSFSAFPARLEDRHQVCRSYEPTLLPVGSFLEMQADVNLRSVPGGGWLGIAQKSEVAEVLDFELRNSPANDRYYRVQVGGLEGYVYAGTRSSHGAWAKASVRTGPVPSVVVRPGERIEIVSAAGIALRATPGGARLGTVPFRAAVVVEEYAVRGSSNEIYYLVSHGSQAGYIYAGRMAPLDTTASWVRRIP